MDQTLSSIIARSGIPVTARSPECGNQLLRQKGKKRVVYLIMTNLPQNRSFTCFGSVSMPKRCEMDSFYLASLNQPSQNGNNSSSLRISSFKAPIPQTTAHPQSLLESHKSSGDQIYMGCKKHKEIHPDSARDSLSHDLRCSGT